LINIEDTAYDMEEMLILKNHQWQLGKWFASQRKEVVWVLLDCVCRMRLMKNLDKFFSKADLLWVKLLWLQYYANGN
jgi:hypothetical protein